MNFFEFLTIQSSSFSKKTFSWKFSKCCISLPAQSIEYYRLFQLYEKVERIKFWVLSAFFLQFLSVGSEEQGVVFHRVSNSSSATISYDR